MSNNVVGNVYRQVIEDVINASRVDFEEGGVDESVLEELRNGWQQKLTQLDVASFPWDPKPEPVEAPQQQQAAAPAPTPQQVQQQPSQAAAPHSQATLSPQPDMQGLPLPTGGNNPAIKQEPQPFIKQEPGLPGPPMPTPASAVPQGNVAQQRAMAAITNRFGEDKASGINPNQQPSQQAAANAQKPPLPTPQNQNIPLPQQQYQQQQPQQQQQQQGQQQQQQQQQPQQPQQQYSSGDNPAVKSQVDGPGDDDDKDEYDEVQGVLMRRDAAGTLHELGRVEIDRLIHSQILSRAKAMEGGGLMLPLDEATKHKTARSKRKSKGNEGGEGGVARYDGEDDEDGEADEDAINSDLDDSDDDKEEEEVDDEGLGHTMLCMYDKVQRVKNKWKCVLKDGVLTVNGKEYLFHKATGEYEW